MRFEYSIKILMLLVFLFSLFGYTKAGIENKFVNVHDLVKKNTPDGCTFSVSPTVFNLSGEAGTGQIAVQKTGFCSWSSGENIPWINQTTMTSNCSGVNGQCTYQINFTYEANPGVTRTASWYIGDRYVTLNQAPICTYAITPASVIIIPAGGTGSFNVSVLSGCSWTSVSKVAWISTNSGANGNGAVNFTVAANTGAARSGTITVGGKVFTVNQQALVCSYTLSETSASFSSAGSNGSFLINAPTGCSWSASSNSSWITTNGAGNGNGTISFSITANTGATRSGTIIVGGKTFTISQQAPACTFTLSSVSIEFESTGGNGSFLVSAPAGCAWSAISNINWITATTNGIGNGIVSFSVSNNLGPTRTGKIIAAGQTFTVNQTAATVSRRNIFDFDGDGKSDISVYRPSNGVWYSLNSNTGFSAFGFGISTDVIVPADYDADGKSDFAVFRNGVWYIQRSTLGFMAVSFGQVGDLPRPGDFDGDGKADISVFRPSNGVWYRLNSSDGSFYAEGFAQNEDIPLIADFNGDKKTDIAVFRPSNQTFYWRNSGTGIFHDLSFGTLGDIPVIGDFTGDGRDELSVFRPSTGIWYHYDPSNGNVFAVGFGMNGDRPVAGDYDGDGKADYAVFRPSSNTWYILQSRMGFIASSFGATGDKLVPGAYTP